MPLRVVVVDDSQTVRRLVSEVLKSEADIEVVGAFEGGWALLEELDELAPDLIVLDVEMPGMSGLEVLGEIRRRDAKLPVIMYTAVTETAAALTLEALSKGANAFATKPSMMRGLEEGLACAKEALVPVVRDLCRAREPSPAESAFVAGRSPAAVEGVKTPSIVAIGCSMGGPNALTELLSHFRPDMPVPVVIVQHMPRLFTKILADRLTVNTKMSVHEATHGEFLRPGEVWIAPGDYHLRLERQGSRVRVALDQSPPENSCRPAIDVLLRSVAATYGASSLAVILTGMGQDGLRGAEQIVAQGGEVIAQDEESSVVWGIPGAVVRAGLANAVLTIPGIADRVLARVYGTVDISQGSAERGTAWSMTSN